MLRRLTGLPSEKKETISKTKTVQKNSGRTLNTKMNTDLIKDLIESWFRATGFIASGETVERFDFENNKPNYQLRIKLNKSDT
jgi:hypothetical protein